MFGKRGHEVTQRRTKPTINMTTPKPPPGPEGGAHVDQPVVALPCGHANPDGLRPPRIQESDPTTCDECGCATHQGPCPNDDGCLTWYDGEVPA